MYFLWADHAAITLFLLPECRIWLHFSKIFQGRVSLDPPAEQLGLCPSTFWSAWRQQEPTHLSSCERPCIPSMKFDPAGTHGSCESHLTLVRIPGAMVSRCTVQWICFSDVTGCTWVICIQRHQRTYSTAPGCRATCRSTSWCSDFEG